MSERAEDKIKEELWKESCMLEEFKDCPYIVNIQEIIKFKNRLYTFIDYMEGGSLTDILSV